MSTTAAEGSTMVDDEAVGMVAAREVHPRAIRWMHWINFPVLLVMVWSGLRIYWANDVYAAGIGGWQWFAFFPEGFYEALGLERRLARGIAFHLSFGWILVVNGVAYLTYLVVRREWRHIVPDRADLRDALRVVAHEVRLATGEAPPHGRYNAAQKIAYTTVLAMGVLIVATGFAIYKPTQLSWLTGLFGGYETARLIHFWTTIGLSLFFAVHLVQVVRAGWANFASMVTGFDYRPVDPPVADRAQAEDEEVTT